MSKIVKPGRQTARPTSSGDRHSSAIPSAQGTHSNHQQIRDFINKLTEIYHNVEDIISPVLNPSEYADLSINCQELKLDSNGLYTNPSPQPYFFNASSPNVTNHPIDLEKNGGKYRVAYNAFGNSLQHYMLSPFAAYPSAQNLCDELDWQFRVYPRKGIEDNLAGKTNWRQSENLESDAVFDREFWADLFLPDRTCSYAPVSSYVSSSNKKCPHIMFSMKHDIKEQDSLLRGEFLAIVAAMVTRLERFSSAQQLYIPVLVLSFMGHLHGREGFSRLTMMELLWLSERPSSIIFCLRMPETFSIFLCSRWQTRPLVTPRGCQQSALKRRHHSRVPLKAFLCDRNHRISGNPVFLLS